MVMGPGGVLAAGIFVGDVVLGHAAAAGRHITAVVGNRVADGHGAAAVALALALFVDLAAGKAADHGADRRGRVAGTAAADLAADRRAKDATDHGRDGITRAIAAAVGVVSIATVATVVVAIVAVVVVVTTDTVLTLVAALSVPGIAATRIEHRLHPDHPGVVVLRVGLAVAVVRVDPGARLDVGGAEILCGHAAKRQDQCRGQGAGNDPLETRSVRNQSLHVDLQSPETRRAGRLSARRGQRWLNSVKMA